MWVRNCRHSANAANEARFDSDVQNHAEHCQPRSLHQRTSYETVQRLPEDQLRVCATVCQPINSKTHWLIESATLYAYSFHFDYFSSMYTKGIKYTKLNIQLYELWNIYWEPKKSIIWFKLTTVNLLTTIHRPWLIVVRSQNFVIALRIFFHLQNIQIGLFWRMTLIWIIYVCTKKIHPKTEP